MRFAFGLVIGILIGAGASAYAAKVVGLDGPLVGWTVTKDGEEVCSDPDISTGTQEIECD